NPLRVRAAIEQPQEGPAAAREQIEVFLDLLLARVAPCLRALIASISRITNGLPREHVVGDDAPSSGPDGCVVSVLALRACGRFLGATSGGDEETNQQRSHEPAEQHGRGREQGADQALAIRRSAEEP